MADWRAYQEEVADHFRQMGYAAEVDRPVQGVRALHKIDVWVQFELYGLKTSWAVECKAWRAKIPKEKVAALKYIVDDVGADRGFLLSEVGFQPGAKAAASGANVTLTSLAALRVAADDDLNARAVRSLRMRFSELEEQLHAELVEMPRDGITYVKVRNGVLVQQVLKYIGIVIDLRTAVERADLGRFPVTVPCFGARDRLLRATTVQAVVGESVLWPDELDAWRRSLPSGPASREGRQERC